MVLDVVNRGLAKQNSYARVFIMYLSFYDLVTMGIARGWNSRRDLAVVKTRVVLELGNTLTYLFSH